jgi:hypothetical protein
MKKSFFHGGLRFSCSFLLLAVILISCGQTESDATVTSEETATIVVPADVILVREAALDYLREIAAIVVPAADVPWVVTVPDTQGLDGTDLFLFSAQDFKLNVSYPNPANAETIYYAAMRNHTLDFCWQAFIDAEGHIGATDYQELEPELVNPARVHCEQQGYSYELRTKEDGRVCGACVFLDGNACNSWDYFYGTCTPED